MIRAGTQQSFWSPNSDTGTWQPAAGERIADREADDVWVVVLAGGQGTRLQQFIRHITGSDRPKQFCRIVGTRTMLRHTWDRASHIASPDRVITVITAGQEGFLAEESADGVAGHVVVQPANKETGPGVLLPLLWIARRSPTATVVVFPADHFIWEEERFSGYVRAAVRSARCVRDRLVILGVEANGPEQSYGWIAPGPSRQASGGAEVYRVRRFWEKPDHETAARLFTSGYLWNTFVLAGLLQAFMQVVRRALPETLESLDAAAAFLGTPYETEALTATYRTLRPVDFSRTLLAGHPHALLVLPARGVYWSDWGDPRRILETLRRFDRRPAWLSAYARFLAQRPDLARAGGR